MTAHPGGVGQPAASRRAALRGRLRILSAVGCLLAVTSLATTAGSTPADDGTAVSVAPASEPVAVKAAPGDGHADRANRGAPEAAPSPDLQAGIRAASREAAAAGATMGVAVLDRVTGQQWTNGAPAGEALFGASLAKLFIADNLLYQQSAGEITLSPGERELLEAILTVSDDSAATTLYARYGGAAMITEVAARYRLPSLQPTNQPPLWELTTISAVDLVRWYDAFLRTASPTDADFLVSNLQASPERAADGFNQYFGIPRALPGQAWGIKQGWMGGVRDSTFLHTSGLLGPDNRYAVAILVQHPGGEFPIALLDRLTALILPPALLSG